jgi:hypothetical protein
VFGFAFTAPQFPTDATSDFETLLQAAAKNREHPIVFVQMDVDNGYSIFPDVPALIPFAAVVDDNKIQRQYVRLQLPLVPAHAITVHKCQGLTAHFGAVLQVSRVGRQISAAMKYVALSRLKNIRQLFLLEPIFKQHFTSKTNTNHYAKVDAEYNRLRNLPTHEDDNLDNAFDQ